MTVHGRRPLAATDTRIEPIGIGDLVSQVLAHIRAAAPIELLGPCGSGKTTMLGAVVDACPDRVVVRACARATVADTVRDLARRLPGARGVPRNPARAAAVLRRQRAVLLLDDCHWTASHVADFLGWTRGCAVVVTAERSVLGRFGTSLELTGLDQASARHLLELLLGRPLDHGEGKALPLLVHRVKGRPLAIRRAAALMDDPAHGYGLSRLAAELSVDPRRLERLTAQGLTPQARRVVLGLALVAGAVLPARVVGLVCDVQEVGDALGELVRRGVVAVERDHYGLPLCRATQELGAVDLVAIGHAARVLAEALRDVHLDDGDDVLDLSDAALRLLRVAAHRREWQAVRVLADVLEPVLSVVGHLDEAREVAQIRRMPPWEPEPPGAVRVMLRWIRERLPVTMRAARALIALGVLVVSLVWLVQRWAVHGPAPERGIPPTFALPVSPVLVEASGPDGAVAAFRVGAHDAKGGDVPARCRPSPGSRFALGRTSVSCTATDSSGLTATGSFDVQVLDRTKPEISVTPTQFEADDAKGKHNAAVTVTVKDAVDRSVTATCDDAGPWPALSLGDHVIRCSATDSAGNRAAVSARLRVVDTTRPVLRGLPASTTVHLGDSVDVSGGEAADGVDGRVDLHCSTVTPSRVGPFVVTCRAADSHGNTATHSIRVTVLPRVVESSGPRTPGVTPPVPVP